MGNSPECLVAAHGILRVPFTPYLHTEKNEGAKKNRNGEWQKRKKQSEAGLEPAIFSSGGKCLIIRPHGLFLLSPQLHIRESIRLVSEAFEGKYVEKKGGRPA